MGVLFPPDIHVKSILCKFRCDVLTARVDATSEDTSIICITEIAKSKSKSFLSSAAILKLT